MKVKEYLTAIITPILKNPNALVIIESQDAMGVLLTMTVHKEDMGLIVGKSGETAKSIRNLVRIVGLTEGARVSVKITEPVSTG